MCMYSGPYNIGTTVTFWLMQSTRNFDSSADDTAMDVNEMNEKKST